MYKKGVSSIVAVVLIAVIVIVAVAVLWITLRPTMNVNIPDSSGTTPGSLSLGVVTTNGYTVYDSDSGLASVQIKRGNDNASLKSISVYFTFKGNSQKYVIPESQVLEPNSVKMYKFNVSMFGKPEDVTLFPGETKPQSLITGNDVLAMNSQLSQGKVDDSGIIIQPENYTNLTAPSESLSATPENATPFLPNVTSIVDSINPGDNWCNGADFNHDGKVSFADYVVLAGNFGKSGMSQTSGDANGDGKVSFADYVVLAGNFGKSGCNGASCYTWLTLSESKQGDNISFSINDTQRLYGDFSRQVENYNLEIGSDYILNTYDANNNLISKYALRSGRYIFYDYGNSNDSSADLGGMIELNSSQILVTIPFNKNVKSVKIDNGGSLTDLGVDVSSLSCT